MLCLQSVFLEFHSHGDREKEKKAKMKHRHEFMGLLRKYVPSSRLGDADRRHHGDLKRHHDTE